MNKRFNGGLILYFSKNKAMSLEGISPLLAVFLKGPLIITFHTSKCDLNIDATVV